MVNNITVSGHVLDDLLLHTRVLCESAVSEALAAQHV